MKKIIFVNACKTKTEERGLAKEMYVGQFSEKAYRYATKISPDKIYFLSTAFHVVEPDQEVGKVNKQFKDMSATEKKEWARITLNQIREKGIDIEKDELIFLTPKGYWEGIVAILNREGKSLGKLKTPLIGLAQGEQIGWITDRLKELEGIAHEN